MRYSARHRGGIFAEQKAESASNYGDGAKVGKSRDEISGGFVEVADDQRGKVCTEIADSIDQAHDGADGLRRQCFGGNGPEGAHGAISTDAAESDEGEGQQR